MATATSAIAAAHWNGDSTAAIDQRLRLVVVTKIKIKLCSLSGPVPSLPQLVVSTQPRWPGRDATKLAYESTLSLAASGAPGEFLRRRWSQNCRVRNNVAVVLKDYQYDVRHVSVTKKKRFSSRCPHRLVSPRLHQPLILRNLYHLYSTYPLPTRRSLVSRFPLIALNSSSRQLGSCRWRLP